MPPVKINVPKPSSEQVEFYLRAWDELENYHLQEDALDKLFFQLCPENLEMLDILLKVAALNDFYSTNIFSVYPVAKHILSLDIDARLESGDVTLVSDLQNFRFAESNNQRSGEEFLFILYKVLQSP